MDFYQEIKDILINQMEVEGEIKESTSFTEELNIDSIEIVELKQNINEKFKVNISLNEILKCDNINDVVECIKNIKKN